MSNYREQLKTGLFAGVKGGWQTFLWMSKIVIPISFLVTLLQWSGWLGHLDFLLVPLMKLLDLPPEAILPILSGIFINIYAVIAIISVVPFSMEQMTMIAIFNLIAHNLILESTVQHKSGFSAVKAVIVRFTAAVFTVLIISHLLGDTSQSIIIPASLTSSTPLLDVLGKWVVDTILLLLKILGIIVAIMIVQECLKALGWLDHITKFFRWIIRVMGLSRRTTLMWLTAIFFGLLYGSAVIMDETRKGDLPKDELEALHISAGINHAMIEDPFLFAVLGLNLLWLWIPRFITAIIAVHCYRLVKLLGRKWRQPLK